ncbi:MAG: TRAP transporter small permease [Spirochaetales bacterium]
MNMKNIVRAVSINLNQAIRFCVFISSLAFAGLIFVSVIFRYIIKHPLIFSVEIAKLLFIWSAFLGVTIGYREKSHIRFEFLKTLLKQRGMIITEVIVRTCSLFFFVIVLFQAIKFTQIVWPTFFPVLNLSQGWLYVSVIVSMIVLIIHSLDLSIEAVETYKSFTKKSVFELENSK